MSDRSTGPDTPPGHVASLVINGVPPTPLVETQSLYLSATAFDRDHHVITGYPVTWTASDTLVASVATFQDQGRVYARHVGTVTISARSDGQETSVALTVVRVPVASVVLSTKNLTFYVGGQTQLTATTIDSIGRTVTGHPISWASSNNGVVRVNSSGLVSAVGAGTATVVVSSEGKSTTVPVTVAARPTSDWSGVTNDWTTYQGTPSHTGYVPATLDPLSFKKLWATTPVPGTVLNPVTAAGGQVFFSTATSKKIVGVIDGRTGAVQWLHDFGAIGSVQPPSYANNSVYVATGVGKDAYLWAFNASDGSPRFHSAYENEGAFWYAPVVLSDTLYMPGGCCGGMYAFSAVDGRRLWFTLLDQTYVQFAPAVKANFVYAYEGNITVLRSTTGTVVTKIPDPHFKYVDPNMNSAPVLGDNNDLLLTQAGRLVAFDLQKRVVAWEITGVYGGQVSVANGVVYAYNFVNATQVEAHRESDGALLWTWSIPQGGTPSPMIVTKNVLLLSNLGATYAVDLSTHTDMWTYPVAGQLAVSKAGVLYIAQANGQLTAISLR